jgi:predicted enzyme related to lactoylglutathione lyase
MIGDKMALFKKVDCLLLKVNDLEAGLEFYSKQLGHEVVWRTSTAAGLKLPESEAELVLSTQNGPETDLKVSDTKIAYEQLVRAGAKPVVPPFEIKIGFCAVVEDPWGNSITVLDSSKGLLKVDREKNVVGLEVPSLLSNQSQAEPAQ